MQQWIKEPFVHFVLIGIGLFVLFGLINDDGGPEGGSIIIGQDRQDYLASMFQKTWQRPPTEEELDGLIEDYLKEEVFYREALRIGLDADDLIIRRRMRQKMEFIAEDMSAMIEPTDEELAEYLEANQDKFAIPARYWIRHVYFNPADHGNQLDQELASTLMVVQREASPNLDILGDRLMLDRVLSDVTALEINRYFGDTFTERISTSEVGVWKGPVQSGYGVHLIIVDRKIERREAQLAEVRPDVVRELMNDRRLEMLEAFYQRLKENYEVVIEEPIEIVDQ